MNAVFLADAHLRREQDPGYRRLLNFLSGLRGAACRPGECGDGLTDLFLLGDIFDFWFNKGERIYPEYRAVIESLRRLKAEGANIHLCEGNHDFFLESFFSRRLGMAVYEDWTRLTVGGRSMLLGHGDLVDQANIRYLWLRRVLRSRPVHFLQRVLPLALLWRIAEGSSNVSGELMGGAEDRIAEAMRSFAREQFAAGVDIVILGHCHKPLLEESIVDGRVRIFVTLGDWLRHYSYLRYRNGLFTLEYFDSNP